MRSRLMLRYVLGEMIPTFFIGVLVFVFILLMLQALRLTEWVLVHGVKLSTISWLMAYMSMSFLPVLFPMSLLFAVLLTYGRLSSDSEVVAFRAVGLSMGSIIAPAIVLSVLIGLLSLQTSFHLAPWGNRQFEVAFTKLGATKAGVTLKEGTFAEGFFDLVVYANKVDSTNGHLSQVFIYNEQDPNDPVTVIAREGQLKVDPDRPGQSAFLRLTDGNMHRTTNGRHTKIDFNHWDIFLSNPVAESFRDKSPQSLTLDDLDRLFSDPSVTPEKRLEYETEFHKRTAIAFACILFAMIGVGLGTVSNRRNVKSGGTVICLALIVSYYIIYVVCEGLARKGQVQPFLATWFANGLFSIAAVWSLRRAWR